VRLAIFITALICPMYEAFVAGDKCRPGANSIKANNSPSVTPTFDGMDSQMVAQGGVSAGVLIAAAILYRVYTVVNHHAIRGRCCGRTFDASIDIDPTTPKAIPLPAAKAPSPSEYDDSPDEEKKTDSPLHIAIHPPRRG